MTTDDAPFAEHPDGQFDDALAAMADAIRRLEELPEWTEWITLSAQGMGSHEDAYIHVEVMLRGDQIDWGPHEVNEPAALNAAGLGAAGLEVGRSGSVLTLGGATPGQRASFLDTAFRTQLGVRGWADQDDDYAVGLEW